MQKITAKSLVQNDLGNVIKPSFQCFCCNDSGLVSECHDLDPFVDGKSEVRFICTRGSCEKGTKYLNSYLMSDQQRKAMQFDKKSGEFLGQFLTQTQYQANFDDRLAGAICDQLHKNGYHQWAESIKAKLPKIDLSEVGTWN